MLWDAIGALVMLLLVLGVMMALLTTAVTLCGIIGPPLYIVLSVGLFGIALSLYVKGHHPPRKRQ